MHSETKTITFLSDSPEKMLSFWQYSPEKMYMLYHFCRKSNYFPTTSAKYPQSQIGDAKLFSRYSRISESS